MNVTLILGITKHESKDGTKPLYLRVSSGKKRKLYPVGIKLEEKHWNAKGFLKPSHEKESDYNLKFIQILGEVKLGLAINPDFNVQASIDKIIYNTKDIVIKTTPKSLTDYIDDFVKRCRSGAILSEKNQQLISEGYITGLETTAIHLRAYEDYTGNVLMFSDLTLEWHNKFITFLRNEYKSKKTLKVDGKKYVGLGNNSVAADTSKLIRILNQATKEKINTNLEYQKFKSKSQSSDNIFLTKEEVQKILDLDLTNHPELVSEQERFSISYNFLLRFKDSLMVSSKNIFTENGIHYFKAITSKTSTLVTIPVKERNYEIITRKGFKFASHNNATSNIRLAKLGELAGIDSPVTITELRNGKNIQTVYKKYELITTHTARRSAATNMFLENINLEVIRKLGGWADLKILQTYLKVSSLENAKNIASHSFFQ